MGEEVITLDRESSGRLEQFARRQGLTQATVLQGLYGLVLARLNQLDEIVIGSVRNGRESSLPGIAGALGLFIGTLPLRLRLPQRRPWRSGSDNSRRSRPGRSRHAHLGLSTVQALAGVAGTSLFEAVFVYENYPVEGSVRSLAIWPWRVSRVGMAPIIRLR